jgi:hypothetical protein
VRDVHFGGSRSEAYRASGEGKPAFAGLPQPSVIDHDALSKNSYQATAVALALAVRGATIEHPGSVYDTGGLIVV